MAKSKTRWNFGMPRADQPRISRRDVRVIRNGRPYTASYEVEDGRMRLLSAWGDASGPAPPEGDLDSLRACATALLEALLDRRHHA